MTVALTFFLFRTSGHFSNAKKKICKGESVKISRSDKRVWTRGDTQRPHTLGGDALLVRGKFRGKASRKRSLHQRSRYVLDADSLRNSYVFLS